MVGRGEFMDVHEAWVRGKSISEIASLTGRDRKTIRRLLREGGPKPRSPRAVNSKLDPYRQYLLGRMLGEDPCPTPRCSSTRSGTRVPTVRDGLNQ